VFNEGFVPHIFAIYYYQLSLLIPDYTPEHENKSHLSFYSIDGTPLVIAPVKLPKTNRRQNTEHRQFIEKCREHEDNRNKQINLITSGRLWNWFFHTFIHYFFPQSSFITSFIHLLVSILIFSFARIRRLSYIFWRCVLLTHHHHPKNLMR
jgi:hypothetical protein